MLVEGHDVHSTLKMVGSGFPDLPLLRSGSHVGLAWLGPLRRKWAKSMAVCYQKGYAKRL